MNNVTVGSRWQGSSRDEFVIKGVLEKDGGVWVHYERMTDSTAYSCLINAFLHRFSPILN